MADDDAHGDILNQAAQGQIRSIIERVERLEAEKAEISEQIKEVFAEAKSNGFVPKILRMVVRIRKQARAKRQEEEAILDLYLSAMGELPLFEGKAAAEPDDGIPGITITAPDGSSVSTSPRMIREALSVPGGEQKTYDQAVKVVREAGRVATPWLQRRLKIGFNSAAGLIERMEREGVVGSADDAGWREVLKAAVEVA